MSTAQIIREKLTAALAPEALEIVDESALHAGHAHSELHPGGETHFRVAVVSAAFVGKPRVARQRLVYGLLQSELANGVHALSLVTRTPDEAAKSSVD